MHEAPNLATTAQKKSQIPCVIQENVSLQDKNWFGTGGASRYFAQPCTAQEFQESLLFAQKHQLPIFMLGKGANILVSDAGFDGITIRSQLRTISHQEQNDKLLVTAGAGVGLDELIAYCFAHNGRGLEEFSGIPSTVGGAVYINLHYFEFLLEHFLVHATVINATTAQIEVVDRAWFEFGYNTSRLHTRDYYLMDATFTVHKVSPLEVAYARGRSVEIVRHRNQRYPAKNTCGSFFRNFYPDEVHLTTAEGKKVIFAAYYLDKVGVKGQLRVGGAAVSHQHANMIVNAQNATSADVAELACKMQELVRNEFDVLLQPECQLIGFANYPLLV